jgi:Immunity protein 35
MIDYETARSIALAELAKMPPLAAGDAWVIVDEETIERGWGWVFFYDSQRHLEGDDSLESIVAGNAPYIVRRSDGGILETGTALDIEDYIANFERSGYVSPQSLSS